MLVVLLRSFAYADNFCLPVASLQYSTDCLLLYTKFGTYLKHQRGLHVSNFAAAIRILSSPQLQNGCDREARGCKLLLE